MISKFLNSLFGLVLGLVVVVLIIAGAIAWGETIRKLYINHQRS